MDFKTPSVAISTTTLIGLVGSSIYFYKEINKLKKSQVDFNNNLAVSLRKIAQIEKSTKKLSGFKTYIKEIENSLDDLEYENSINKGDEQERNEQVISYLEALKTTLEKDGKTVDIKIPLITTKSIHRKHHVVESKNRHVSHSRNKSSTKSKQRNRKKPNRREKRQVSSEDSYESESSGSESSDASSDSSDLEETVKLARSRTSGRARRRRN
jgi:hypothetical protein